MTAIAFLACETTVPGNQQRREDAFEHDLMIKALAPAFEQRGLDLRVIDWEAEIEAFDGIELAMLGTAWNYQDKPEAFLTKLEQLESKGIVVCNSSEIVRWNSRKTYLQQLAEAGAPTIPTLWFEDPTAEDIRAAFDQFDCDKLVVKRQIGAGALGQQIHSRDDPPSADWSFGHKAMAQPFLASIQEDGELSFIFVEGELSHALRKRPAAGEYRIQSLYGGIEQDLAPTPDQIAQAQGIMDALPFDAPLYGRIDMLKSDNERLLLMEAELVEPYLYPEQGPGLGNRIARAIAKRLNI